MALIGFTNAWPTDPTRDWHFPIASGLFAGASDAQLGFAQIVKSLFFQLDPVPDFGVAFFTAPLPRFSRRVTGVLVSRRDRLQRPTYLAVAHVHGLREPQRAIWMALHEELAPFFAPDSSAEAQRELAKKWEATPTLGTVAALGDIKAEPAALDCEARLQSAGRGWREFYAALDRAPTAAFTTPDGRALFLTTPDGEFGPVDALDLWTLWFVRHQCPATAAFSTLTTVRQAVPRHFSAVARFGPADPLPPSPNSAEAPTPSAGVTATAAAAGSSGAVVSSTASLTGAGVAEGGATASTSLSGEIGIRHRRRGLWIGVGLVATAMIFAGVSTWILGPARPTGPADPLPADASVTVPVDADASVLRHRLAHAFREFRTENPPAAELALSTSILAEQAKHLPVAAYLRFLVDGAERARFVEPPTAPPTAAEIAVFFDASARVRDLQALHPEATDAARLRRQLGELKVFVVRHLPWYAAIVTMHEPRQ